MVVNGGHDFGAHMGMHPEQAEFVIVVRAFDDTFSQTVNARYSYRYDEMVWSAKFEPAFEFDEAGNMVLHVDRVSNHAPLAEPVTPAA